MTDNSHAFYPRIINRRCQQVRCASDEKKIATHALIVEKHYRDSWNRGSQSVKLLIEVFAKVARVCCDFTTMVPSWGSVLCRGCIRIIRVPVCVDARISRPWKPARIHRIFFSSLRVKEGHREREKERESHCFSLPAFRDPPIFSAWFPYIPRLPLTNTALSLAKSFKCVYYFSPLLPRPSRPRICVASAYSAFLFNRPGSKYGEADDSPHSVLGALARVNTYLRENRARCFSLYQAEINHYRARLE